jgi:hypothetical protein
MRRIAPLPPGYEPKRGRIDTLEPAGVALSGWKNGIGVGPSTASTKG